ncbi:MAG: hypothetical protein NVSMB70_00900 [Chamaesiphon sp.]
MSENNVNYLTIQAFIKKVSGVVSFGTAPDGLPLLTTIQAPPQAKELLQNAAWALGAESQNPLFEGTPLEPLVRDLDCLLKAHLIQHLPKNENTLLDVMVLPNMIRSLCGATLLERLLTQKTSITKGSLRVNTILTPASSATVPGSKAPLEENVPQPKFKTGELCLGLPMSGYQPVILRKEASVNGWPAYSFLRNFIEESITPIKEGQYEIEFYDGVNWCTENVHPMDIKRYQSLRLQRFGAKWSWHIPRNSVAQIILDIAIAIAQLHSSGEIHGDVKPENILLTNKGIYLFDSLGLVSGMRSPAMTLGWAAPEQVLGNSVSSQTDQYPIGLMLLDLLQGVLYGEETKVLIPVGGRELETHTVLKNPGVYIDPDTAPVETKFVSDWSNLVAQCIRFDSSSRFESMTLLVKALRQLVEHQSLKGSLKIPLAFGTCVIGNSGNEDLVPCWLVG